MGISEGEVCGVHLSMNECVHRMFVRGKCTEQKYEKTRKGNKVIKI